MLLDQVPEHLACHALSTRCDKQIVADLFSQQHAAPLFHVATQPVQRLFPQRHQTLLVALARHPHNLHVHAHLIDAQAHQFRYTQTGGVQHFKHGAIAQAQYSFCVRCS